jgi:hypothetical protein
MSGCGLLTSPLIVHSVWRCQCFFDAKFPQAIVILRLPARWGLKWVETPMTSNDLMLSSVDLMQRCGVGGVVSEVRVLVSEHDSWTTFHADLLCEFIYHYKNLLQLRSN